MLAAHLLFFHQPDSKQFCWCIRSGFKAKWIYVSFEMKILSLCGLKGVLFPRAGAGKLL